VRAWARLAISSLTAAQPELDRANVFPVADGDTGTNLLLTVAEGVRAVDALDVTADGPAVLTAFAAGCRQGARGNSGVLTAEWVRALASAWYEGPAHALDRAAGAAHDAVGDPVEGTLLTVARAAADGGAAATGHAAVEREQSARVLTAAAGAARDALARTPDLLPDLHGELDAGAHGLVLVIESLARAFGATLETAPGTVPAASSRLPSDGVSAAPATMSSVELMVPALTDDGPAASGALDPAPGGVGDVGDVEVLLDVVLRGPDGTGLARALRDALGEVGGSVAVAGGDGAWRAHVHTSDPASAVCAVDAVVRTAGGAAGAVRDVQVRRLDPRSDPDEPGVVALTSAPGLLAELARAGAVVLLADERHPADESAVRRAAEETGASVVEVLRAPDSDLRLVAALAELATAGGSSGPAERAEALRTAAARLDVAVLGAGEIDDPRRAAARASSGDGSGESSGDDVVLVLHGERVASRQLDALAGALADARAGTEVVVLASGRDDATVEIGLAR
jgi:hypothetical protein